MKLIKALSMAAPAPIKLTKRLWATLTAFLVSRIPSFSPISQWGKILGLLGKYSSPQRRISTFSLSSLPIGVESLGKLGNCNNKFLNWVLISFSWGSNSLT